MGFEEEGNNLYRGLAYGRVQADMRTHLIHRPARDIIPPLSGARVFLLSHCTLSCLMLLQVVLSI